MIWFKIVIPFLICCILITVIYLFISYNKLKKNLVDKINMLHLAIENENFKKKKLTNSSLLVNNMSKKTAIKFNTLITQLLNFEFSLSEIFKSSI